MLKKKSDCPFIPGYEGSGTVVSTGGGLLAWRLVGKRVAVVMKGLWAEYAVVDATNCIVLPDDVSFETGANSWVNPMTVMGFLDVAYLGGHKSIVHTAAASALGKILIQVAKNEGIDVICVVRKEEQIKELTDIGAKAVFSTSSDDWKEHFKAKCAELNCTLAFDAVAGDTTGLILHAMPKGSCVKVYGGLSEQPCHIPPGDFIFQNKRVEGFWLTQYLTTKSYVKIYLWQRKVVSLLNTLCKTNIAATYSLDQISEALASYRSDMSKGKVLIVPNKDDGEPAPKDDVVDADAEGKGKEKETETEASSHKDAGDAGEGQ